MQLLSTEMPSDWLQGVRREWVTSVVREPSEGGVVEPVAQQIRPLLRFTVDVFQNNSEAMENLYIEANGPEMAFLCKCPLTRDHQMTAVPLGVNGTGAPGQTIQLKIKRGQTWDAYYPIAGTITIYANGVAVSGGDWTLGLLGSITGTFPSGQALTATFQYKTKFGFLENSLVTVLQEETQQRPQQVAIEEII